MDVKQYVSDFQMVGNTIRELSVKNSLIGFDSDCDLKRALDLSHKVIEIGERDDIGTLGIIQLNTVASLGQGKKKIQIKLTLEGAFTSTSAPLEEFEKMLVINGLASLYSIARSIIINISAQALTHGSIVLPMINVYQYSEDMNTEQE